MLFQANNRNESVQPLTIQSFYTFFRLLVFIAALVWIDSKTRRLYCTHRHIHILYEIISVFSSHPHALYSVNWCARNSNVMLLLDCCWSDIPCDLKAFINVVNAVYVHSCDVLYAFSKYHLTYERFQDNDYVCRTVGTHTRPRTTIWMSTHGFVDIERFSLFHSK